MPGLSLTFEEWMKAVDAGLVRVVLMDSRDLVDCNYRDWYDDEMSVDEAVQAVLEENGADHLL